MALDIHKLENGKRGELLFQIDDAFYGVLYPAFEHFKQQTGLFVDPYGDLVFSSGHAVLLKSLEASHNEVESKDREAYDSFMNLLQNWEDTQIRIVFLGD